MRQHAVLITGLPASGKTTLGKRIAAFLGYDFFDKDDFLETLFTEQGCSDEKQRLQLSRQSDRLMQQAASDSNRAVLVSHWSADAAKPDSGTDYQWVIDGYVTVSQLYCDCPVAQAHERFHDRQRHPGHQDGQSPDKWSMDALSSYQRHLPLPVGRLETVNTASEVSAVEVATRLLAHL